MTTDDLFNRATALARMWATAARPARQDRAIRGLAAGLAEPAQQDAAAQLLDRVWRPSDAQAAMDGLADLAKAGAFLGPLDASLIRGLGAMAPYLPARASRIAAARIHARVRHLLMELDERALTRYLADTLAHGQRVNLNLLGQPPAGEREARARARQLATLLARPDVDYVSVDPATLVSQISPWDLDGEARRIVERLRGLFELAAQSEPQKFIHLNMGRYRDLALTCEVFERVLSEAEFMHFSAGITLQSYLPESFEGLERLIKFATNRVQAGGAPIKVRIVKGTLLAEERVGAAARGWVSAPYPNPVDTDAQFLRLLDRALRPEVAYALRVGVGTNNLFHVAHAHLCAQERGVEAALDIELLHGISEGDVPVIAADAANPVIILTPVVEPNDPAAAIPYLIPRLADIGALAGEETERLMRQESAFLAASTHVPSASPRRAHERAPIGEEFFSTPDSDPALARTRAVMRTALTTPLPAIPVPLRAGEQATDLNAQALVAAARQAAPEWAAQPAAKRAKFLRRVAHELERRRERLIPALARETGAVLSEADAQVSIAVDYARYYAEQVVDLEAQATRGGLKFTPDTLVLVTPSWSAPVADAMGGVLGALAVGSAAILKPAPQTPVSASIAMEAVHEALTAHESPTSVATLALHGETETGRDLVSNPGVDTVLLSGSYETARLFTSWRARHERGPRVFGETSGKNSVIVTPSADLPLAVKQIVHSAFAHSGQRRSAASLLILVGSLARSTAFKDALVDAVESLRIDYATHPAATIGPLYEPPSEELLRVLTELDAEEVWLVKPHQLDEAGRLWRPGIKAGVQPGSDFHLRIYPAPVLGVMVAKDLAQAIEWHNATSFGLTAGIHSLDPAEVDTWLEGIEAANTYVNKPITDARPGRQPFGGWKQSSVGAGAKAGGPHFLGQLGRWVQQEKPNELGEIGPRVGQLLDSTAAWLSEADRDWLRAGARSDGAAREVMRTPTETAGLPSETNLCRYRPGPRITIRAGENARLAHVLRISAASWAAGVEAGVSVHPKVFAQLPSNVQEQWRKLVATPGAMDDPSEQELSAAQDGIPMGVDLSADPLGIVAGWRVEHVHEFTTRASTWTEPGRIRILDSAETAMIAEAVSTAIAVLPGEALQDGSRELLTFLREQSVSWAKDRYGHVPVDSGPVDSGGEEGNPQASA